MSTHIHTEHFESPTDMVNHVLDEHGTWMTLAGKESWQYWNCLLRGASKFKRHSTQLRKVVEWEAELDMHHGKEHTLLILKPPTEEEVLAENRRREMDNMTIEELHAWVNSPEQQTVSRQGQAALNKTLEDIQWLETYGSVDDCD